MESDHPTKGGPDDPPLTVSREGVNAHVMPYSLNVPADMLLVLEGERGQYPINLAGPTAQPSVDEPGHGCDMQVALRLNNQVFTVQCDAFELTLDLQNSTTPARSLIADFSERSPPVPAVEDPDTDVSFDAAPDAVKDVAPVRRPDTRCARCGELFYLGTRPWAAEYSGDHYGLCDGCGSQVSEEIRMLVEAEP